MTDDRNTERRAEYRIKKRAEQKAKQFARKIAGFLNGQLNLHYDLDDGTRVFADWYEEAACCRSLADYLATWKKCGHKLSRSIQQQIASDTANLGVLLTQGENGPQITLIRRSAPAENIEGDVIIGQEPELTEQQMEEIEEIARSRDEERGRHIALKHFLQYIQSPASNSIERCDRPACSRHFVRERSNQTFCSGKCAKMEARKHSTARTRANLRQKILLVTQAEMDRLDGRRFASQSKWKDAIVGKVNKLLYETGNVITAKWVTRAIRTGELAGPRLRTTD